MRTIEVNVYKFSELSSKAKERAKHDYMAQDGYVHADEAFASLKALVAHFNGTIKDYSIDWFACSHSTAKFDMPEYTEKEINALIVLLGEYNEDTLRGNGECVLTGYCADEDAIDGLRKAFHEGERDTEKLMQAAFQSWLKASQDDCLAFYEDEEFSEHCDCNDYEFYADGRFAS